MNKKVCKYIWGFLKIRGTIFRFPITRIIVFWGLHWHPLIWGTIICIFIALELWGRTHHTAPTASQIWAPMPEDQSALLGLETALLELALAARLPELHGLKTKTETKGCHPWMSVARFNSMAEGNKRWTSSRPCRSTRTSYIDADAGEQHVEFTHPGTSGKGERNRRTRAPQMPQTPCWRALLQPQNGQYTQRAQTQDSGCSICCTSMGY